MKNSFRIGIYNKFKCIADRCSFSCCEGWDILVDPDTYQKWASSEVSSCLCDKVRTKKVKDSGYYMKLERGKHCPFLREDNFCNMVIAQGEEYLPKTCREFPRLIHRKEEYIEYSLSCACPAVIDLLKENTGLLQFAYEGDKDIRLEDTLSGGLRDTMLYLLRYPSYTLRDRLLLIFHMLLTVREYTDDNTGDMLTTRLSKVIKDYKVEDICTEMINLWSKVPFSPMDSLTERNELFLDIIQNYKTEKSYQGYLIEIDQYAQNVESVHLSPKYNQFLDTMRDYEQLLEHSLVTKVFAYCIQEEPEAMIMSYQMIVTEYVMVLHATYLRQQMREEAVKKKEIPHDSSVPYQELRDDIVLFSRIIGYNLAGMKEFWEDSFDEPIWEIGYLLLLLSY